MCYYWPGNRPSDDLCRDRKISPTDKLTIDLLAFQEFIKDHEDKEMVLAGMDITKKLGM